jgi:hypothetical protein
VTRKDSDIETDLAFTDVPGADSDAEIDPHWLNLRGGSGLPMTYLPPAMPSDVPRPPWQRALAVGLVIMFVGATAAGVCLTYGPPSLWR